MKTPRLKKQPDQSQKKVLIVTDSWLQNSSGVVTALKHTKKGLEAHGFEVIMIHPHLFRNIPLPFYKELRMALFPRRKLTEMIREIKPDFIHISTEGSLGATARMVCAKNNWGFTSAYHTRMPEYVGLRIPPLEKPTKKYLKWLHKGSKRIIVSTPSLKQELKKLGFKNVVSFPLGVDLDVFKRNPNAKIPTDPLTRKPLLEKPIFAFLGRVAPEKNIEAFLHTPLPGSKLIIGSGPAKKQLQKRFPDHALFVGHKSGQSLVDLLSISDVLVFPSRTDTFGLVIIEALACGVPVAAYNVHGPKDIIKQGITGFMGGSLAENAKKCLSLSSDRCRKEALKFSWDSYVENFIKNLREV